jgi:hypothetical protein
VSPDPVAGRPDVRLVVGGAPAPHDAIRKPGLNELDQVLVPLLFGRPISQPGHDYMLADRFAYGHGRRLNRHRTPTNTMQA